MTMTTTHTPTVPVPAAIVTHTTSLHDGLAAKMAAGGLSCMIISTVLNPMDVVKIRLQTQNQLVTTHSHSLYSGAKYRGMTHGLATIGREEGFRGLMRGITPSLLREASYSSIRMGLYDWFKGLIQGPDTAKHDIGLATKILAGVSSGALGSSIATPIDLCKIRFQAYSASHPNPHSNTFAALYHYAKTSGIRGLYTGIGPTTVRAAILNGSSLASYDHSKSLLIQSGYGGDNISTHLVSALVSGLVTTTTTNPFDVIKTRVMSDGQESQPRYRGSIDCAVRTWRSEGVKSFAKGWLPNYLRLGPHFILSLPLAEFIRIQLGADTF